MTELTSVLADEDLENRRRGELGAVAADDESAASLYAKDIEIPGSHAGEVTD